ncbi:hypothetical protein CDD81_7380 [Ophiocordyceps australis]|uniref:Uncharacterized protein n=1 Tax=Ophiocordyceps australis TaxID=1399860 RepID=A0A2C5Y3D1_9HYPO|nr:hypothetical protein CDD81_7380 [Ophiocordyceps australis]
MPASADTYPISAPISPPPPQSLTSYSRFIHDHTKRQMQSFGAIVSASTTSSSSSLANGVTPADYQT